FTFESIFCQGPLTWFRDRQYSPDNGFLIPFFCFSSRKIGLCSDFDETLGYIYDEKSNAVYLSY
ncbi:MAG: hypothetical protein FWD31_13760, partial [Planctomycetaceae bacterium]|nr:hypothetical protein [Planctomycetaceae bacterium]